MVRCSIWRLNCINICSASHIFLFLPFLDIPMLVNYKTANCPTDVAAAYKSETSVQCFNFRNIPLGNTNIEFCFSCSLVHFSPSPFASWVEKRINQKKTLLQPCMKRNRNPCFFSKQYMCLELLNEKRSFAFFLIFYPETLKTTFFVFARFWQFFNYKIVFDIIILKIIKLI